MDREECDICQGLKVGFRFAPSPHEVLLQYLIPMIQKQPLPCDRIIKQADVYGASTQCEVFRDDDLFWQSASSGKKKTIYVFTKLSKNGKRVSRRAGRGTWVGQSNKKIKDKKSNEVLGSRGAFTYKSTFALRLCLSEQGSLSDPRKPCGAYGNGSDGNPFGPCNLSIAPSRTSPNNNPNIPMLPGETDQPIPFAEGVIHNVPVADYQPGTANGNNQSSATIPLMDEGELESLVSLFASLPGEDFDDYMQRSSMK
ncbi:hypothetical protein AgCh_007523 [Apium graveolens]